MLEIIKLDNELLRQKSEPVKEVNDEIRTLINEMFETMDAAEGVGLAAPQVGKLLRLCAYIPKEAFSEAKKFGYEEEDILQESVLAFLRALNSYDEKKEAGFRTYASVCIKNHILLKKQWKLLKWCLRVK